MRTAAALFDELTELKFALEAHNALLAVSGWAAASERLRAVQADATFVEQSRVHHTAQLAQARTLQAAIEESGKLVEDYKKHEKEIVKARTARTTSAAAVRAAEDTLALVTEGSDEHQELTESLTKARADFKLAEADLCSAEQAERKAGLTVRLRELTTLLPELLLQFPELDLLFGTAAAGLQVSRSVARDDSDHEELQSEPTRVVRATLVSTGEQCVLKRVAPSLPKPPTASAAPTWTSCSKRPRLSTRRCACWLLRHGPAPLRAQLRALHLRRHGLRARLWSVPPLSASSLGWCIFSEITVCCCSFVCSGHVSGSVQPVPCALPRLQGGRFQVRGPATRRGSASSLLLCCVDRANAVDVFVVCRFRLMSFRASTSAS